MDKLPLDLKKYFWGDKLDELSWEKHKDYITKTILEKGDRPALKWLFERAPKTYLKKIVQNIRLDSKSKNFWGIYLS